MKTIKQTVTFKASPSQVYEALMDSKKHAKFTGDNAKIGRNVGDYFTAYGSYIEGYNLELVKNKKIVQLWRGSEFPANHFSKVTFLLSKVKGGAKLSFKHENVPDTVAKDINEGWKEHYWDKMKEIFGW